MAELKLLVKMREKKGKEAAKKIRNKGVIPGVLYGLGEANLPLQVEEKELLALLKKGSWENTIIDLKIEGEKRPKKTLIREIQTDPLTDRLLHVDFLQISLTEKVRVPVPVILTGEPVGVKSEGGILEQLLHSVEVECLPRDIPENFILDVSGLKIGESIHILNLPQKDKISIITEPEQSIVTVLAPTVETVPTPEEAVAEAVLKEPEVITKERKKEEAVEEGEKE
ncbi:MAG: 50S ribosomal protein L25 [Candidatus Edwardsbacteria bacterium]